MYAKHSMYYTYLVYSVYISYITVINKKWVAEYYKKK